MFSLFRYRLVLIFSFYNLRLEKEKGALLLEVAVFIGNGFGDWKPKDVRFAGLA
jgi:hypothetical protein